MSLCIKRLPLKSSPKIFYLNEWANVFLCTCSVYPSSYVYMHIAHLWMSLYLWLHILGFCTWKFGLGISSVVIIWKVVQFRSVAQLCLILCNHMDCGTPDLPVHHQLLELTQTHVHRVGDSIQPSPLCHLLLLPPSIFSNIMVFSKESVLRIRRPPFLLGSPFIYIHSFTLYWTPRS